MPAAADAARLGDCRHCCAHFLAAPWVWELWFEIVGCESSSWKAHGLDGHRLHAGSGRGLVEGPQKTESLSAGPARALGRSAVTVGL